MSLVQICIVLMVNNGEYLFRYMLAILMSSLEKCLFRFLSILLIRLFFFATDLHKFFVFFKYQSFIGYLQFLYVPFPLFFLLQFVEELVSFVLLQHCVLFTLHSIITTYISHSKLVCFQPRVPLGIGCFWKSSKLMLLLGDGAQLHTSDCKPKI